MTTAQEHILILAEPGDGRLEPVTFEMVAVARELASNSGRKVSAALVGAPGSAAWAGELFSRGVATVYTAEHQQLAEPNVAAWTHALGSVIQEAKPTLVLLGHTTLGRDLAPYLALRLGTGVVMHCAELRWDSAAADVEAVCPVFGGDAHAVYRFGGARPRIVTMNQRVVDPAPAEQASSGEVVAVDSGLSGFEPRSKVLHRQRMEGPRLEDARVVVSGGLGLQIQENYAYIEELAEALGGLPGASRAIVDAKWVTSAQQVGLTGKVVSPDLYVAVGISGASQHMAGCSSSKVIVAINEDSHASIFRYAKYGIATDCLAFLPVLIEESRKFLAQT